MQKFTDPTKEITGLRSILSKVAGYKISEINCLF